MMQDNVKTHKNRERINLFLWPKFLRNEKQEKLSVSGQALYSFDVGT